MTGSHSPGRKTLSGLLLVLIFTVTLLCTGCTSQTPASSGVQDQAGVPVATGEGAAPGDLAEIDYTGTLSNGSVFDSSKERGPFQFILGSGTAIPGFDDAIQGMKVGETKTFTIPPEEAYGEYNASLIQVFPIDFIPPGENVTIGDTVTLYNGQSFFQAKIAAMNATNVTFDLNSPLAGEALTFSVTLVNLTPAADVAELMSQAEEVQNTTS